MILSEVPGELPGIIVFREITFIIINFEIGIQIHELGNTACTELNNFESTEMVSTRNHVFFKLFKDTFAINSEIEITNFETFN